MQAPLTAILRGDWATRGVTAARRTVGSNGRVPDSYEAAAPFEVFISR